MENSIVGLDKLKGDWEHIDAIVPYGAGLEALRTLKRIITEFNVPFIVDRDSNKSGQEIYGIPIENVDRLKNLKKNTKVLITVAKRRYDEIKKTLENYGLEEDVDFCHISQFGMEWYYKYRGECNIFTMDITVTTYCTLHCKHCNMFVPHYKQPVMYRLDDFKRNIDCLFKRIDFVFAIGILGGEAFVNPELVQMLEYLCNNYHSRFGSVLVTTNGLTIPSEEMLKCFKIHDVIITISDYRSAIQGRSKIEELSKLFEKEAIVYTKRESLVWCDFGFPHNPADIKDSDCTDHMKNCDPGWRGLNDEKFYFCNVAWSAEKAGLFSLKKTDYLNLEELEPGSLVTKKKILSYTSGNIPGGYMSFCKVCRGCGEDNQEFVKAGEQ